MTKQDIINKTIAGEELKYSPFIKGVFSNSTPSIFTVDGRTYCCVEQYYAAEKARTFGDDRAEKWIMILNDPIKIREYGRRIKGFVDWEWDRIKERVMYEGVLARFKQSDPDRNTLIKTEDQVLVYCNPADRFWGAGIDAYDARLTSPMEWPGENRLGFILGEVRELLKTK